MPKCSVLARHAFAGLALLWACAVGAKTVVQWNPLVEPFGHIYPALDLTSNSMPRPTAARDSAAAILGNLSGSVGVRLRVKAASRFPVRVQLRIAGGAILPSDIDVDVANANTEYLIYPTLRWDLAALATQGSSTQSIDFSLEVDGLAVQKNIVNARIHALNDALIFVEGGDPGRDDDLDFNWIFAAYVDESSEAVDELSIAANDLQIASSDDLGTGETDANIRQVFALWHVLQQRGLRYVGVSQNASAHPRLLSQRVRFPDQSWAAKNVNCVDGSILLAAAMLKNGIEPVLAIIPGHMFLGFYLDSRREQLAFLDISLLSGPVPAPAERDRSRFDSIADSLPTSKLQRAFDRFAASLDLGQALFLRHQAQFDLPDNLDFQLVSISDARAMGVLPLRRSSSGQFGRNTEAGDAGSQSQPMR